MEEWYFPALPCEIVAGELRLRAAIPGIQRGKKEDVAAVIVDDSSFGGHDPFSFPDDGFSTSSTFPAPSIAGSGGTAAKPADKGKATNGFGDFDDFGSSFDNVKF